MRLRAKPPAASNLFTEAPFPTPMRIAAVGDVHGGENLPGLQKDLETLPRMDLFLLAGELTHPQHPDALRQGGGGGGHRCVSPVFGAGCEKEEWRPELGSKKLEAVILRRRPDLVIHGHIHKGIPFATLATGQKTIEDFDPRGAIPVYNVAYPVTRKVTIIEEGRATFK